MTCFASVFLMAIVRYFGHRRDEFKYYLLVAIITSIPLNFICSFRYDVGEDYQEYVRYFNLITRDFVTHNPNNMYYDLMQYDKTVGRVEFLYYGINKLIGVLGGEYYWLFVVCSSLFFIFTYLAILRDSPSPEQSVYFLVSMSYCFIFMNGMRQMIGCAILLFSLRYVEERKILPFLLCVVAACGFHMTSVVFLLVYFLGRVTFKPIYTVLITVVVFALSSVLGNVLTKLVSMTYYGRYIGSEHDSSELGLVVLSINIVIFVLATIFYDKNDIRYKIYYNMQVFALYATALTGNVVLISRLRWTFGFPSIILLPLIFSKIRNSHIRLVTNVFAIALYFAYCTYRTVKFNSNSVLPYQTIFSFF